MGKHDSSRTRAAPVFNWLLCKDPTGATWLPSLLSLPKRTDFEPAIPETITRIRKSHWWPHEKTLRPPPTLLEREGLSHPDVFLETDELIVVIEGKRRESRPDIGTKWMPKRHQMLRQLDCAWEWRKGRKTVLGFFIVEADPCEIEVPARWHRFALDTISEKALDESLPHRPDEREKIARAFLGVTTWEAVCQRFGIPDAVFPCEEPLTKR